MKRRINLYILIPGIIFILISLYLIGSTYQQAALVECGFPADTELGGVPVGGLTAEESKLRVFSVYTLPFTIQTESRYFTIDPVEIGFTVDAEKLVKEGLAVCENRSLWQKFNQKIWNNREAFPVSAALSWDFHAETFRAFLQTELLPRYEIPAEPTYPLAGTTQFAAGKNGRRIDQAVFQDRLIDAFLSPTERLVELPFVEEKANPLTEEMLLYQLQRVLEEQNYTGLVELQTERLSDNKVIHFAYHNLQPVQPGVAFTAASTMKIPILLSSLSRTDLPLSDLEQGWITYMLIYSENDPADRLMEQIDFIRGPLVVTEDMQGKLGLENTFIAGYFYLGAPLLDLYQTPANQRSDININADLYNQTTAADISSLLGMLYECEQRGSGPLVSDFGEDMTQEKCQLAVDILKQNRIGALIESGLPEGTPIAHKHGWSEEKDGLVHTFSDVGIVYAPENDFVLSIFIYSPNQLLFDTANLLTAQLSQVVYNFMNPEHQIGWVFGL